jgi:hypothetical protein
MIEKAQKWARGVVTDDQIPVVWLGLGKTGMFGCFLTAFFHQVWVQ